MARISTYQVDTNVTGADIWIGTDGNDNKKTKNFSPNILAKYLNENEVISTANSLRYRYDTIASGDSRKTGTISFQTEIGANVAFSSITTFILSNKTLGSTTVDAFLNILPNTRILIQNSSNINFFGIYFVDSITPHLTETGYYVVNLTYVSGNGNLSEDMGYLIHLIEYKTVVAPTPTLQSVTSAGSTTTTTVHLDGGALSDSINEQSSFSPGSISTVNKNTGAGAEIGSTGYLAISPDGVSSVTFSSDNITQIIELQAPNKPAGSYTLATTEDITIPTLQSVTDEGSITTNTITIDSVDNFSLLGADAVGSQNKTNDTYAYLSSLGLLGLNNGTQESLLSNADVTNSGVVLEFPNKTAGNYTIATTDNLSAQGLPVGGTAGQILTKVNSTDYNATWTNQITQENIQDYVAPLFVHNNHTNASVTYEDVLNEIHIDVINAPTAGYTSVVKHEVKLGTAIAKGQAVYVSSADGTNMIVSKASNVSEATSSKTMGLLEAGGSTNAKVNVVTEGLLAGLNTAGQTAGDPVWLGTNGDLIYGLINKPYAPAHLVFIGIVTRVNSNNGEIFVKCQNGFELKEIHDVDLITTTPINGDLLGYNGTLWVNKTIAGWLGYTPTKLTQLGTQTLAFASWSLSGGYYIYTFSNINITSTSVVDFTPNNASINEVSNCRMLPQVDVASGSCTFYATFPPQSNITGTINVWQ